MTTLSEKRIRLLEVIARYQRREHFPLVRELARELGLAGESSITRMLRALVESGHLEQQGGGDKRHQRIYILTRKGEAFVPEVRQRVLLPRLGRVTAGLLREAIGESDDFVDVGDLLKARPGDFLLDADGDSMIGDGILDGDWIQVRPNVQIHNNEIAAVQVKQGNGIYESTLKRVRFQPGKKTVTLRASNPVYDDIVLPAKRVEVVGAYRGLIRPVPTRERLRSGRRN